jgi:hypothetical protein
MPFPAHGPYLFYPLSPEAYLLTGGDRTNILQINEKSKEREGLLKNAGLGVWPVGGRFFSA